MRAHRRGFARTLTLAGAIVISQPLPADVVTLRSGAVYPDVKTVPFGELHKIQFMNGFVMVVPNSQIKSVRPGPTSWMYPVTPAPVPTPDPVTKPVETVPPVKAESEAAAPRGRWSPILKSIILPGWGQFSEGREVTGIVYGAGAVFAFQRYWTLRQRHAAAQRQYNDPVPTALVASQTLSGSLTLLQAAGINYVYLAQKQAQVYSLQNEGNNMLTLATMIWMWNLLDIGYGGFPLIRKSPPPAATGRPTLNLAITRESLSAGVRISF